MVERTTQILLTEDEVALALELFRLWENNDLLELERPLLMNQIYDYKAKLDEANTAFHGNKRGGM